MQNQSSSNSVGVAAPKLTMTLLCKYENKLNRSIYRDNILYTLVKSVERLRTSKMRSFLPDAKGLKERKVQFRVSAKYVNNELQNDVQTEIVETE